ncbi:MAG: hypothetical protein ACR2P5_09455 [Gammaproteobacteria bacterium]
MKTILRGIFALFAAVLMAVSPIAFADSWEVRSKTNPLDDDGKQPFIASGDFVSPIPGHSAAFPYNDLQAKLSYECKFFEHASDWYMFMLILFNKKPNIKNENLLHFRLKGDGGETQSVVMSNSHVYGLTFAAIKKGGVLSSVDTFNSGYVLPYDSIIVGVPWADDGEVLFKFQITPEMKAAAAEIDGICEGLKGEVEDNDGGSKRKAQSSGGNK